MTSLVFLAAMQLYEQVLIVVGVLIFHTFLKNGSMDFIQTFTQPLLWLPLHTVERNFGLN